jgi:ABC-type multidrug transport system permease subunit
MRELLTAMAIGALAAVVVGAVTLAVLVIAGVIPPKDE